MAKVIVTLLTLLCFVGCTTFQPLPDAQPATIEQQAKPGTRVEIERVDGTRVALVVDSVSADTLVGVGDGKRYEIPLASIRSIGTRTMTTQAKVWTIVGVVAAVAAIAAGSSGDGGGSGY